MCVITAARAPVDEPAADETPAESPAAAVSGSHATDSDEGIGGEESETDPLLLQAAPISNANTNNGAAVATTAVDDVDDDMHAYIGDSIRKQRLRDAMNVGPAGDQLSQADSESTVTSLDSSSTVTSASTITMSEPQPPTPLVDVNGHVVVATSNGGSSSNVVTSSSSDTEPLLPQSDSVLDDATTVTSSSSLNDVTPDVTSASDAGGGGGSGGSSQNGGGAGGGGVGAAATATDVVVDDVICDKEDEEYRRYFTAKFNVDAESKERSKPRHVTSRHVTCSKNTATFLIPCLGEEDGVGEAREVGEFGWGMILAAQQVGIRVDGSCVFGIRCCHLLILCSF